MNVKQIDHMGVAVHSIAEAAKLFVDTFGGEFVSGGDDERIGIRTAQIRLGGFKIELMEPLSPDSYLQRFLDKHGPGFHHMTIFVDDVVDAIADLEAGGYEVVDTNLEHSSWRETFVRPKTAFGTLLQVADSDLRWDVSYEGVTLEAVIAGRVLWNDDVPELRS